jgi:thiamine pyrophosphokinase
MDQTAVLFVNGELKFPELIRPLLEQPVFIIAVDGGLKHLNALNFLPDLLIGDLDSIDPNDIIALKERKIEIIKYPGKKNESDLELAVQYSVNKGFNKIVIVGALGGRVDHTLVNINLLSNPEWTTQDMRLFDGVVEIRLIRNNIRIDGKPDDLISLIPITKEVLGVKTQGLYYRLENEDLYRWETRGLSNVMIEDSVTISLQSGLLICIHEFSNLNVGAVPGEKQK